MPAAIEPMLAIEHGQTMTASVCALPEAYGAE